MTGTFTVNAWTITGFYQPVDMNGVVNTVKGGSTVPLKFNIYAGGVERTSVSDVMYQIRPGCRIQLHRRPRRPNGGSSEYRGNRVEV